MIKIISAVRPATLLRQFLYGFATSHTVEPAMEPYLTYRNAELDKYMVRPGNQLDGGYS